MAIFTGAQTLSEVVSSISHSNAECGDITRGGVAAADRRTDVNSSIASQGALKPANIIGSNFIAFLPRSSNVLGFDCAFPEAITLER